MIAFLSTSIKPSDKFSVTETRSIFPIPSSFNTLADLLRDNLDELLKVPSPDIVKVYAPISKSLPE